MHLHPGARVSFPVWGRWKSENGKGENGKRGTKWQGWKWRERKSREIKNLKRLLMSQYRNGLSMTVTAQTHYSFRVVPSLYYQLFTVFVPHADYSFPVFYALMTRKTKDLYVAVMRMISQLAPDFQPTQVIADFEEAPTSTVLKFLGPTSWSLWMLVPLRTGLGETYANTVCMFLLTKYQYYIYILSPFPPLHFGAAFSVLAFSVVPLVCWPKLLRHDIRCSTLQAMFETFSKSNTSGLRCGKNYWLSHVQLWEICDRTEKTKSATLQTATQCYVKCRVAQVSRHLTSDHAVFVTVNNSITTRLSWKRN